MSKPFYSTLYFRVLVAIAIGVALGIAVPDVAVQLKPLGDGFIKLVRMTIAPLIFCTVVVGVGGMKTMKEVGKVGGLAVLYFEVASTVALVIGLVIVNVFHPGSGMNIDPSKLDPHKVAEYATPGKLKSTVDFVLDIIPDSLFGAVARGELLPTLLAAILFGFALHATGERGKPVLDLVDRTGHVMFEIVAIVMKLAPVGALGRWRSRSGNTGCTRWPRSPS